MKSKGYNFFREIQVPAPAPCFPLVLALKMGSWYPSILASLGSAVMVEVVTMKLGADFNWVYICKAPIFLLISLTLTFIKECLKDLELLSPEAPLQSLTTSISPLCPFFLRMCRILRRMSSSMNSTGRKISWASMSSPVLILALTRSTSFWHRIKSRSNSYLARILIFQILFIPTTIFPKNLLRLV